VAERTCHVFLAPHYDDVALSCGGTVAQLAESGAAPLIVTIFGGLPAGPLTTFASDMHALWGVGPHDVIATRRAEERCAAEALGANTLWLDFADAIYREDRYTSDPQLFGTIDPAESSLAADISKAILAALAGLGAVPASFYVPLAIGNHVDHQHVFAVGKRLAAAGHDVWAYEDFPYAGDPAWRESIDTHARAVTTGTERLEPLTPTQLKRRIDAVLCYGSQLDVIFRHQGDPAEAIRRYAQTIGHGQPAERFWRIG
jgi:LmbE family N-acetylglucosaminyl deacetylase